MKPQKGNLKFLKHWTRCLLFVSLVVALMELFFWARQSDDFARRDITLAVPNSGHAHCFILSPRSEGPFPLLILLDGTGRDFLDSGATLRKIAELGFTCVFVNTAGKTTDEVQVILSTLIDKLATIHLIGAQGMVYLENQTGPDILLATACGHNEVKPDFVLYIKEETGFSQVRNAKSEMSNRFTSPIMIIANTKEIVKAIQQSNSWAAVLKASTGQVELATFENANGFPEHETLLLKEAGEVACAQLLKSGKLTTILPLPRRHTSSGWIYVAPPSLLLLGALGILVFQKRRRNATPAWEWAKWATAGVGVVAGASIGMMVQTKSDHMAVILHHQDETSVTLSDYAQAWQLRNPHQQQIEAYVSLADYNRTLVNWNLSEKTHEAYVLCPNLTPGATVDLNWRQPLWTFFYPAIRSAASQDQAAAILVQKLREEVEIREMSANETNIMQIWNKRLANPTEFEAIYVAALRSVGVPARLDDKGYAEIWNGGAWKPAARPGTITAL